jgi:hypothetical protein
VHSTIAKRYYLKVIYEDQKELQGLISLPGPYVPLTAYTSAPINSQGTLNACEAVKRINMTLPFILSL